MRKTLGCLLAGELGIQLRRVGSGKRMTFVEGEQALSAWMAENAYVSWIVRQRPWELEDTLIAALDLPLNLIGNKHNQFHPVLEGVRARCSKGQGSTCAAQSRCRRPVSLRDRRAAEISGHITTRSGRKIDENY